MKPGWRHADFAARVGDQVTLRALDGHADETTMTATLSTCTDAVQQDGNVSYRVTFLAAPGAQAAQAMYLLEVAGRDPEPIFLVPIRQAEDRLEYEAVFNQAVGDGSGP